ncbi:MAG TPA: phytanoyl-CoA dioxygenase family protein [Planctomycetota bacterium]|nr:phytanoyl-CoA dioxygenase family protein [Planctomycetota bacterium]
MSTAVQERLTYRITPDLLFLESNDALNDADELRRRLRESGYLFLRGMLNVPVLMDVRRDILELCRAHGWLKDGSELVDGIYSGIPFPDYSTEYMALYRKLIKLPSFNAYSLSPEIIGVFEKIFGCAVLAHPRNIARITFPRHKNATQPHQDFHYIRGTTETYTTWIPVGDCPMELGGLALMEGSHKKGYLKHEPAIGAGGQGVRVDELGLKWRCSDYHAGDILIMHSLTVHAALDNDTSDRLRLSLDYRYQRQGDPIDPSSLKPHGG